MGGRDGSMELGQIQVVWESDCNVTFARCSCCVCVKSFGDVVRSAWGEKHQGEMNFRTGSIAITDGLYEVVTTAAWDLWSMSHWNYWRFSLHWLVTITCV